MQYQVEKETTDFYALVVGTFFHKKRKEETFQRKKTQENKKIQITGNFQLNTTTTTITIKNT